MNIEFCAVALFMWGFLHKKAHLEVRLSISGKFDVFSDGDIEDDLSDICFAIP